MALHPGTPDPRRHPAPPAGGLLWKPERGWDSALVGAPRGGCPGRAGAMAARAIGPAGWEAGGLREGGRGRLWIGLWSAGPGQAAAFNSGPGEMCSERR